jgi:PTS system nitrogen regulatory IIA component
LAYGIEKMLAIDMVLDNEYPSCKKQLLQILAERTATKTGIDKRKIFDVLLEREQLGSTGVGNGIAIPHGKLPELQEMFAIFARLRTPVKYDSLDDQPVDIVFLLLAPKTDGAEHLKALSRVARVLRDNNLVDEIRNSADPATIFSLLTQIPAQDAA